MGFNLTLHVKDEEIVYSTKGIGTGQTDLIAGGPKFPSKLITIICNHANKKIYCRTMHVIVLIKH